MRRYCYIVFIIIISINCSCAQVFLENEKNSVIYATILERYKIDNDYPTHFLIVPKLIHYDMPHLKAYNEPDSLLSFMNRKGWSFVFEADTSSIGKKPQRISTKKILAFLKPNASFKDDEQFHAFSPIIYSKDLKKAFVFYQINNPKGGVFGPLFLCFENISNKWILVKESVAPLY